jgi:hypothetical protein
VKNKEKRAKKCKRQEKITTILVLTPAFCFVLVSLVKAGPGVTNIPIWQITQHGTANPRFAIYDPSTPGDNSDELVLDKETGLIWARDANLADEVKIWSQAISYCRSCTLSNRKGWRSLQQKSYKAWYIHHSPIQHFPADICL